MKNKSDTTNNSDVTNNSKSPETKEKLKKNRNRTDREGERRKMKCREYAKIVEYKNSQEIIVEFEETLGSDGKPLRKKTKYAYFISGQISPVEIAEGSCKPGPNVETQKQRHIIKHKTEKIETPKGPAIIEEYRNARDIDLKLEDGTIIEHVRYYDVIKQSERIIKRREQSET